MFFLLLFLAYSVWLSNPYFCQETGKEVNTIDYRYSKNRTYYVTERRNIKVNLEKATERSGTADCTKNTDSEEDAGAGVDKDASNNFIVIGFIVLIGFTVSIVLIVSRYC